MTSINRRNLFSVGFATAGLSLAPSWLSRWFGPQDPQDADPQKQQQAAREQQLRAAIDRSRQQGKPLLVFVVPEGEQSTESWQRGRFFGAFLNHGSTAALLEVALCVPACARISALGKLCGTDAIRGEPTLLLVDVGAAGAKASKVTAVDMNVSDFFGKPDPAAKPAEQQQQRLQHAEARIEQFGNELLKAMHRHGANLMTLAGAVDQRLGAGERQVLTTWFSGGKRPDDALLVRAAAIVRRRAGRQPDAQRGQTMDELLNAVKRHVVEQPVAGARWMIPGGCGCEPERPTKQEKEQRAMIACGMAMVMPLSERFLSFYVSP